MQTKDNRLISLSKFLKILVCLSCCILSLLFIRQYVFGCHVKADILTYFLMGSFCFFLYHFVSPAKEGYETSIRLGVGFFILMVFIQRMLFLMFSPQSFGSTAAAIFVQFAYTVDEFNYAIFSYGIYCFVFYWGMKIASSIPCNPSQIIITFPSFVRVKTLLYIVSFLSIIVSTYLSSVFGWIMGMKWESGWIIRLFPNSLYASMLGLLIVVYGKKLGVRDILIIISYFLIALLAGVLQGSRGSIYLLFVTFFTIVVVVKGNYFFKKIFLIKTIVILVLTGPLLWISGNAIRDNLSIKNAFIKTGMFQTIESISHRLSESTEHFIIEVNNRGDQTLIDSVFSLNNVIKAAINGFVPGEIFDVPFESTGNLWRSIFLGEPIGSVLSGHVWSGFGFFYVMFKKKAMLAVFFFGLAATLLFKFLIKRRTLFHMLCAVQVYFILFNGFFFNGNLDIIISDLLYMSTYITILFLSITLFLGAVSVKPRIPEAAIAETL